MRLIVMMHHHHHRRDDNDDDDDDLGDQVWDLGNKKAPLLHTLDDHLGYVTCIEWIPGNSDT